MLSKSQTHNVILAGLFILAITLFILDIISISLFIGAICLMAGWLLYRLLFQRQIDRTWDEVIVLRKENQMLLNRYEVLTDNLAAAIIIRDAKGSITYCSPYTEVLTGYTLDEIYNSEVDFFERIIHQDDLEKYHKALKVAELGEAFQYRFCYHHKADIQMWAETRTVPVTDNTGKMVSSLSVTIDVTGTVRYQKQVEEKNRDLEDFSYMISHDLKAPIFTIKGMLQIINDDYLKEFPEELKELVTHIEDASSRLKMLVTSVLEYSRISRTENSLEEVDLSKLIKSIERELSQKLQKIGGEINIPEPLPVFNTDQLKVYQIFSNLIGNAVKYHAPERKLLIEVLNKPAPPEYSFAIAIKDNGSGIAADKIEHVFRPFQRAHGSEIEGSGIGLSCVRKLLEKLHGHVELESIKEEGSIFTVYF